MTRKISFIMIWLVIALFLLPGGMASWQESIRLECRITTTEWTGNKINLSTFEEEVEVESVAVQQEETEDVIEIGTDGEEEQIKNEPEAEEMDNDVDEQDFNTSSEMN
jgi:hypothetical protein